MTDIAVRAYAVEVGDYLLGVGRVQAITQDGPRITLHGEGGWHLHIGKYEQLVVRTCRQTS